MAEIRLICPGCAAEYRLSDAAVPPGGREVECSACGHVWHATPRPDHRAAGAAPDPETRTPVPALPRGTAPANDPPAGPRPPLSRPLPPSVLDILRDEVEHERRARAADAETPAADARDAPRSPADPAWPATTVTRRIDPGPSVGPAPDPAPVAPPAGTARPALQARPAAPDRGRYAAGFGLAVLVAATAVVLYAIAPALADQGALGEALAQARAQVDGARLWLQDRVGLPR